MSHASMLKNRRKHQKTKKLIEREEKHAKRRAKQALAGPAVKKEKVKKEKVKKEKVKTQKKEKKVKLTKEELGRQEAKKGRRGRREKRQVLAFLDTEPGQLIALNRHNLLNWQEHLPVLFAMKAAGQLRYVGITTSEGRRHREVEQLMRSHPLDFVQVTYNPADREADERILPLARERGIAVIANRPFREGALTRALARQPLPPWAAEVDCTSWAELVLKFIVSHPAVTCAIPATTSVAHVRENMNAAYGRLPDASMRQRIVGAVERA